MTARDDYPNLALCADSPWIRPTGGWRSQLQTALDEIDDLRDEVAYMRTKESDSEPPTVCEMCGHPHTGPEWGFICIGCPCPETPAQ